MFGVIKWVFWISVWVLVAAFFHYTLPQRDVVRVVGTYEEEIKFGENSLFWASPDVGSDVDASATARYVKFIQTIRRDGKPMVYRNEDTGWGWPPYFKFDTSNLHTEAVNLISTEGSPRWALITHYGWRNELITIFPNAISVTPVSGPDASKGIPWLNIIILTTFFLFVYGVWVRWRRFREANIDPTMEAIEDDFAERSGRFKRWLATWRAKN